MEHSKPRRAVTRTPLTEIRTLLSAFDGMMIGAHRAGILDDAQVKRLCNALRDEIVRPRHPVSPPPPPPAPPGTRRAS